MENNIIEFYFSEEKENLNFDMVRDFFINQLEKLTVKVIEIPSDEQAEFGVHNFCITDEEISVATVDLYTETFTSEPISKNLRVKITLYNEHFITKYDNNIEQLKHQLKKFIIANFFNRCFWLTDYQSEKANEELARKFYRLENKFRNFINLVMIKYAGANWFFEEVPYKFKKKYSNLSKVYKEAVQAFEDVDDTLYCLLTDELATLLEEKRKLMNPIKEVDFYALIDILNNGKKQSAINKLTSLQIEKKSLFDTYFTQFVDRKLINEWELLSKTRNHIAHNKLIDSALANRFISDMKKFNVILDEGLKNVNLTDPTQEQMIRDRIIAQNNEAIIQEFAEMDSGINVRNYDSIMSNMAEVIDSTIDDFYEYLSERDDFEIVENNSFGGEKGEVLISARYMPKDEYLIITVNDVQIVDESGSTSTIEFKVEIDDEVKKIQLSYQNGEYEYNEEQANFMPVIEDTMHEVEFKESLEQVKECIDDIFPNFLQEARDNSNSYHLVKAGEEPTIMEDVSCPNCDTEDSLSSGEEYFEQLGKEWGAHLAICLACGEICEIQKCENCGTRFLGDGNEFLCEHCHLYLSTKD